MPHTPAPSTALQPQDADLLRVVGSLTLREKAALCSGRTAWHTRDFPKKGLPGLLMADGPHGVRVEDLAHRRENGGLSRPATCFPPQATLACSWSPQLVGQVGAAIAAECRHYGVGLLLGPGVNIKRSPLCGRNFEYYSEDPLLSGRLAAGFIRGVQGAGVGCCIKHYAVNNQEKNRMSINAAVDDRALFDLYLKAFAIAIREAAPDAVMASYNRVNGVFATEHPRLLRDILRLRFGFGGAVISDWGAVNNRVAGLAAGMDLEMPGSGGVNDDAIVAAVRSGRLTEDALDAACWNIARLVLRRAGTPAGAPAPSDAHTPGNGPGPNWQAHHQLAAQALCQSAVLLKNDGMLPLSWDNAAPVAVIGALAQRPRIQGSGSSIVNPTQTTSFLAAIRQASLAHEYAAGYRLDADDENRRAAHGTRRDKALRRQAVALAQRCGTAVVFVGLPDAYECEGLDRRHLRLPPDQLALLQQLAGTGARVCVVLCCGGPVQVMPWLKGINALLCPHLSGQAMGHGLLALLLGRQNPSGKLAESWPLALEDTPAYHHFPAGPVEASYNESLFVGYRYYDTAGVPVAFPFGFGLSYTRFAYNALSLASATLAEGQALEFSFTVENTGALAGEEIAQVYLARPATATMQPQRELLCFAKVALAPGQQRRLHFTVPYRELAFYDVNSGADVVQQGAYTLYAGPHSRRLPLAACFTAEGVQPPRCAAALAAYGQLRDNRFPTQGFAAIYGGTLLGNAPAQKGDYTTATTLAEMQGSSWGRLLRRLARLVACHAIHFSPNKAVNRATALAMADDLPFKNLPLNAGGILSWPAAAALLDLCNGRGGFCRFVRRLLGKQAKNSAT